MLTITPIAKLGNKFLSTRNSYLSNKTPLVNSDFGYDTVSFTSNDKANEYTLIENIENKEKSYCLKGDAVVENCTLRKVNANGHLYMQNSSVDLIKGKDIFAETINSILFISNKNAVIDDSNMEKVHIKKSLWADNLKSSDIVTANGNACIKNSYINNLNVLKKTRIKDSKINILNTFNDVIIEGNSEVLDLNLVLPREKRTGSLARLDSPKVYISKDSVGGINVEFNEEFKPGVVFIEEGSEVEPIVGNGEVIILSKEFFDNALNYKKYDLEKNKPTI